MTPISLDNKQCDKSSAKDTYKAFLRSEYGASSYARFKQILYGESDSLVQSVISRVLTDLSFTTDTCGYRELNLHTKVVLDSSSFEEKMGQILVWLSLGRWGTLAAEHAKAAPDQLPTTEIKFKDAALKKLECAEEEKGE